MTKKILIALLVFTIAVIGYVVLSTSKSKNIISPIVVDKQTAVSPTRLPSSDIKYIDEAGFSFAYPDNLILKKIETKDQTVYSSIEITSKDHKGKLSIIAVDSQFTKIADYFKKEKTIRKLKLADLEAGQIDKDGKLVTAALDQGVLFTLTADYQNSKAFWLTVNNKILASFAFVPPAQQESVSQESGGLPSEPAIIDEGEEVIN